MIAKFQMIALLRELRPTYGAVGSRDVDVHEQQQKIDTLITAIKALPTWTTSEAQAPVGYALFTEAGAIRAWFSSQTGVEGYVRSYGGNVSDFEPLYRAPPTASSPVLAYPDTLTAELQEVLGWPNFRCAPFAHAHRDAGVANIPHHAEEEQAFIIDKLIRLVLLHGSDWKARFSDEMCALLEVLREQKKNSAEAESTPQSDINDTTYGN